MPTSMRLTDLEHESIWAWCTMAGLLFNHVVLERDALGVVSSNHFSAASTVEKTLMAACLALPDATRQHKPTAGRSRSRSARCARLACAASWSIARTGAAITLLWTRIAGRTISGYPTSSRASSVRLVTPTAAMGYPYGQRRPRPGVWVAGPFAVLGPWGGSSSSDLAHSSKRRSVRFRTLQVLFRIGIASGPMTRSHAKQ